MTALVVPLAEGGAFLLLAFVIVVAGLVIGIPAYYFTRAAASRRTKLDDPRDVDAKDEPPEHIDTGDPQDAVMDPEEMREHAER